MPHRVTGLRVSAPLVGELFQRRLRTGDDARDVRVLATRRPGGALGLFLLPQGALSLLLLLVLLALLLLLPLCRPTLHQDLLKAESPASLRRDRARNTSPSPGTARVREDDARRV